MIGYFGDIIFETSDKKICNFNDFKQAASANYSEHSRYRKKSEREFISPNNEGVSFTMKIRAGHGVRPRIMKDKLIKYCESGKVCPLVIGGHKIGGGYFAVMSGPCSVESKEQITYVAQRVQAAGARKL